MRLRCAPAAAVTLTSERSVRGQDVNDATTTDWQAGFYSHAVT